MHAFSCKDVKRVARTQGFTLLELLIVVIIVGILASVAIPQLSDFVEKSRGAEAAANLDAMRTGVHVYRLENNNSNPSGLANIDVTINNSPDWTFSLTSGIGTATKARAPFAATTYTLDVNGSFGGSWPFVPSN